MQSRVLLDTNIVIRFLVNDHVEHHAVSKKFFYALELGEKKAMLLDLIIGEIIYVLSSVYKHNKKYIVEQLKLVLSYEHLYLENKPIMIEALDTFVNKNIDFVDAILCAKKNLEGYEVMSFDKDLKKC
jgi:predicted nucleic-acid-binding protein